jgi:restriction system protein
VVGGAGDLGADVIALAPDGRKIVLQAKRYGPASKVVGPDLQRFGGTCFTVHRAGVAAVVTTSTFTKQARDYASHAGIHLFDQQRLAAWASRTGPAPWH